jgi:hypothetical protein
VIRIFSFYWDIHDFTTKRLARGPQQYADDANAKLNDVATNARAGTARLLSSNGAGGYTPAPTQF